MNGRSSSALKVLGVILLIAGLILLVIGIMYYTIAANKLPSFLGKLPHSTAHRDKRGLAGVVGGVVLIAGSALAFWRARASAR